ncbi:MAG TPA: hypothetical protein VGL09_21045 [Methylomirabilota bacterium]|jgi:hypothetical protein
MPHCPPDQLDDLDEVLAEIRAWPGVVERKPGVFYLRNQPFLHFHLLEGGHRHADVKGRADWLRLALPRPLSASRRRAFVRQLRIRHAEK